tara:strand:- start:146 stop:328 length:183 start_codon:yes stop_codon:yes gene_type:complete
METCAICEIGNTSIITETIMHNGDEFTSKYRLCDHCGSEYADTVIAKENKNNFLNQILEY